MTSIKIKAWHVLVIALILAVYFGYIAIPGLQTPGPTPTPTGDFYVGNLQVNIPIYDVYDDSAITATGIVCKLWHADQATLFGSKTTPDGDDDIQGQVTPEDNAILYLSVDHVATVIYYTLDAESEGTTSYLTAEPPTDVDDDGVLEHYFKVDLTTLTPLTAGETQKEITLALYSMDADYDYTLTSIAQATSADYSGSTYLDAYATAYWASGALGDGGKMVRVELTLPDAANETMYSNGKVKNIWISIQGDVNTLYKWTNPSFQPAQDRFLVWEASDVTQEVNGKPVMYGRNTASNAVGMITVHVKCANFGAGEVFAPTIQITLIDPAGTLQTAETLELTFTDT